MFVQVIEGQVRDAAALRKQMDRWVKELKPGAAGYLGSTGGITDGGQFVEVVRFESAEAARANGDRPEQGAWFAETAPAFDGAPTFADCDTVDLFLGGGSDDAGFVQVMEGTADREQLVAAAAEMESFLKRTRPELIGGLVAWHPDGSYTQVAYFTSEDEARVGEAQELSEEDIATRDRIMGLLQDVRFLDLREPWLDSA